MSCVLSRVTCQLCGRTKKTKSTDHLSPSLNPMISFKGVCYIQMVSQDIAAGKRGTYIGKFRILFKNPLTSERDTIVGGDTYKDV